MYVTHVMHYGQQTDILHLRVHAAVILLNTTVFNSQIMGYIEWTITIWHGE